MNGHDRSQGEHREPIVEAQEARPPPGRRAAVPPRPATGRRGRPGACTARRSQSASLVRGRRGGLARRSLRAAERRRVPAAAQPVAPARPPDAGPTGRLVHRAPERVEHEVPRPDVADLATTEAGLEMGDAPGREAPQVVARRALLPGRPDRLPLEQVVGPALGTRPGSCRRTAPRPAVRSGRGRAWRAARRRPPGRTATGRGPAGR